MKRAADLSSGAHTRVMRETQPGMTEGQVQAVFEYHTAMGGSERPAYVPVVASGLANWAHRESHAADEQSERAGHPLHQKRMSC
jgi:Xaa-Pro aminopeptidase